METSLLIFTVVCLIFNQLIKGTPFDRIIPDFEEPIQLHMIGGYADSAGKAQKLTMRLLRFFMTFNLGWLDMN